MAAINFDATQVEPSQNNYEPLPAGWYEAAITASDMCPTKAGDGQYLKLEFTILSGDYANRKVWTNLNLVNKNAQAVEIANAQLSGIAHAVNVLRVQDSVELHDKPLEIYVGIQPAKDGYEAQNNIKAFESLKGNLSQPQQPAVNGGYAQPSQPAQAASSGPGAQPWKR